MVLRALSIAVVVLLSVAGPAAAQEEGDRFFAGSRTAAGDSTKAIPGEEAWQPFFRHEGVAFSFVHYRRADNQNAGIVLRLINENDYAVRYSLGPAFLAASRAGDEWRRGRAGGTLEASQVKTGSPDGLFWMPFTGVVDIAEMRLPKYQVVPVE